MSDIKKVLTDLNDAARKPESLGDTFTPRDLRTTYMHIHTGSVDSLRDWIDEIGEADTKKAIKNRSLVPVVRRQGSWEEVDDSADLNDAARKPKPFIGKADGMNWAVQINGVDNDFPKRGFGGVVDNRKALEAFKKSAKKTWIDAKGKASMAAVKRFLKSSPKPTEFFATWKPEGPNWKDDSFEIWYKVSTANDDADLTDGTFNDLIKGAIFFLPDDPEGKTKLKKVSNTHYQVIQNKHAVVGTKYKILRTAPVLTDSADLNDGYSLYWEDSAWTDAQWKKLVRETQKILKLAKKHGIKLAGWDGTGQPEVTDEKISLNGKGSDGYESFTLEKNPEDTGFAAVKTAYRPYDAVVASILFQAMKIKPNLKARGDGGKESIRMGGIEGWEQNDSTETQESETMKKHPMIEVLNDGTGEKADIAFMAATKAVKKAVSKLKVPAVRKKAETQLRKMLTSYGIVQQAITQQAMDDSEAPVMEILHDGKVPKEVKNVAEECYQTLADLEAALRTHRNTVTPSDMSTIKKTIKVVSGLAYPRGQ